MNVYFIGAKNPETRRQILAQQNANAEFVARGFIDNDPAKWQTEFIGLPVLGGALHVPALLESDPDPWFVNLITGSTHARLETSAAVASYGGRFTNLVHPTLDLTDVRLGVGNYIQEGVIIQARASIGNNCSVHIGALVAHEVVVGNSVFIAHAASISGEVTIGDGAFIGTNATIVPRRRIGRWATVGAGAVVTADVPDGAVVVGSPARVIRTFDGAMPDTGDPLVRPA